MRFVPVLVPAAIATAIGVIVAAQAGWLDRSEPEPAFLVRADRAIHGAPPQDVARTRVAVPLPTASDIVEPTSVGRSVARAAEIRPGVEPSSRGSGGASLAMDGAAEPVAGRDARGEAPDPLRIAQAEAAKAKQDVFEVTQASIAAQRASEAEFERQKAELVAQIGQLQEAATAGTPAGAASPSGPRSDGADTEAIAAVERKASEAQTRAKDLGDKVAALQGKVAADAVEAETAADTARALAAARAQTKDLGDKVAALETEAATTRKAAEPLAAKAEAADRLGGQLASARQREKALLEQVASLQADASDAARLKVEGAAAGRKVAALQQQLEDSRLREVDAGAKLATLQATAAGADARAQQTKAAAGEIDALRTQIAASRGREQDLATKIASLQAEQEARTKPAGFEVLGSTAAQLQDDLAGARRGQDTLRRENAVLQRELGQAKVTGKLLGEKLAALQVGLGQPVPPVPPARRSRAATSPDAGEHGRMVRQLDALKRQQRHQQLVALQIEAASIGRARGQGLPTKSFGQGARFVAVRPIAPPETRGVSRRRAWQGRERDATSEPPVPVAQTADRSSATSPARADRDGLRTITTARALIQSGDVEGARDVLRRRGGAVATRALADTYNPLVNSQLGVFGIDSDSDKAQALYQQAAREKR